MRALRVVSTGAVTAIVLAVLAWATIVVVLYNLQDNLVYPAPGGIDRAALDQSAAELGVTPVDLVSADGTRLYAWHRAGARPSVAAVLYLHGNAATVAGSAQLNRWVTRKGVDFLTVAYRGYPGSEGHPSEDGIAGDARAAFDWLVARGIAPDRIAIHGQSLGGGVAVRLASEVTPGLLVLESTFTSVTDLAAAQYPYLPVRRLLRHKFPSAERLAGLDVPVLVLHSADDQTIPVAHGRALARARPDVRFIESTTWQHGDSLVLSDPAAREAYAAGLAWLLQTERPVTPWPMTD